jgi:hypothetical protein
MQVSSAFYSNATSIRNPSRTKTKMCEGKRKQRNAKSPDQSALTSAVEWKVSKNLFLSNMFVVYITLITADERKGSVKNCACICIAKYGLQWLQLNLTCFWHLYITFQGIKLATHIFCHFWLFGNILHAYGKWWFALRNLASWALSMTSTSDSNSFRLFYGSFLTSLFPIFMNIKPTQLTNDTECL